MQTTQVLCGANTTEDIIVLKDKKLQRLKLSDNSTDTIIDLSDYKADNLFKTDVKDVTQVKESDNTFDFSKQLELYISPDDNYAALVENRGVNGMIIDLKNKTKIMDIRRGSYYYDVSNFSIAFVKDTDRTLLIFATDWNRLELYDLTNKKLVSERPIIQYGHQHYMDFFHGKLHISPNQQYALNAGWCWNPCGVVEVFDINEWIKNPYETEDGKSIKYFGCDTEFMHNPVCWINNDEFIMLSNDGDDDDDLDMHVNICNRETQIETDICRIKNTADGKYFVHFDKYVYIYGTKGVLVLDLTGKEIYYNAHIFPLKYHNGAKKFITLQDDKLALWKYE
jgi:hypothetical protein